VGLGKKEKHNPRRATKVEEAGPTASAAVGSATAAAVSRKRALLNDDKFNEGRHHGGWRRPATQM
jgi:hypothetical protein